MKEVTIKQRQFIQKWIELGNRSEAYRQVYNTTKDVTEKARQLAIKKHVKAYYNDLNEQREEEAIYGRAQMIADTRKAIRIALGEEDTFKLEKYIDENGELIGKTIKGREVNLREVKNLIALLSKYELKRKSDDIDLMPIMFHDL